MSVLVYAESSSGICKKPAFEAVTFGKYVAELLGVECIALTIGTPANATDLGIYGAIQVKNVPISWTHFDSAIYAKIIAQIAEDHGSTMVVLSHSAQGKALAGRLSIKLAAGLVSGVNSLPIMKDQLVVQKSVYSGKAVASLAMKSQKKVVTVQGNSIPPVKIGDPVSVSNLEIVVEASKIIVESVQKNNDVIALPEAELVVSGGRGFKGPENWGILEELAKALGAATACSRPVADSGWRPHHEHVGQTGVAIRPNLYIAIGISGAIQHLGGVNNSKTIVVINKDAEAPFFKAADYGVVGDLFEVVPRLTEAVKKYKA
jgi:electron transfer flavoprotein alpha subunit